MCCNPMNPMLLRILFHRERLGERPNACNSMNPMMRRTVPQRWGRESRISCNLMNPMLRHTLSHRGGGDGESRISCNHLNPMLRRMLSHREGGAGGGLNVLQSHEYHAAAHCVPQRASRGAPERTAIP